MDITFTGIESTGIYLHQKANIISPIKNLLFIVGICTVYKQEQLAL